MEVQKDTLVAMKGIEVKILYKLIGNIVLVALWRWSYVRKSVPPL